MRHYPARVGADAILAAVRALGYAPEIVSTAAPASAELRRVDVALLPDGLQQLFARSRAAHRPILLDFFAPD